ncbi:MAG: TrkA C-terminal domain-containing protein, partial [Planctomycetota bacterium]
MAWITELLAEPIAGGVLGLFAVIAAGLGLGKLRVAGVSVGVAGVLFAGLVAAAAGLRVDGQILKFTGEIGLILFVYAVGLSVGPALLGALRSDGLVLNGLAAGIVIVGATLTYGLVKAGLFAMPIGVGVFCGATTNTPALGAATKLLDDLPADSLPGDEYVDSGLLAADGSVSDLPAVGYAVAYPFGVVGIIVTTLALKVVTKTDPAVDASELQILAERSRPVVARGSIRVTNPNLDGRMLKRIPGWRHRSVVVSRILRGADLLRVDPGVEIRLGDVISVVGDPDEVDEFRLITGETADVDPYEAAGPMVSRRLVVTNRKRAGQAVGKLRLAER